MKPVGVALILVHEGMVLLGLRNDNPEINLRMCWTIPSGGIEPGESPEDAAHREIEEEFGYNNLNLTRLGVTPKGNVLFYAKLDKRSCFPKLRPGEEWAWGFFTLESIRAMNCYGINEPLKLGGILTNRVWDHFDSFERLVKCGELPPNSMFE